MWQTRARLAITFANDLLIENATSGLIILGVSLAGLLLAWIFIRIGDFFARRSRDHKSGWRLFSMLLALSAILVALTFGFNLAGFNFWTIAMGYGFLAIVLSAGFGSSLRATFGYFLISLTSKIDECQYLHIDGIGEGRVDEINFLWVKLTMKESGSEIQIPTFEFVDRAVVRNRKKEDETGCKNELTPQKTNNRINRKVALIV